MKVFITGASGYIGSAVAAAFAREGYHVRGLVRSAEKGRPLAAQEIEPVIGTLEDPASLAAGAADCHILIHTAVEYSARTFDLDRSAVRALTGVAAESKLPRRFIYTSGVWVYGDTAGQMVDEGTRLNPAAPVVPRADVEALVLSANTGPLRTLVLRPGCVYGGSGSLTASWFDSATSSGAARFVGEGKNRWAMIHLADLADAYVRAARSALGGEVFNLTDRSRFTVEECARAASHAAGKGGKTESLPLADARGKMGPLADCLALDQHVSSAKAHNLLGWNPRHAGFADGAARYYQAWKALQKA
jgi:nucleoside-diphosphate-sugar epimerase